ncbi:conserved hypothetical protein [Cupriavidus oxalaticus]|jgi:hypothetical protein|uniref:Uncharacterized protein n=1 Tax=Cupriavidus oxalaticus TaxID=96344 RepID=A0A976BC11_9BURK|nr:conserved hypothetical protein [Cupriavidus oxalaticus]
MAETRARVAKAAGLAVLGGLLVLGFVGYLRPSFVVELSNMVLAWCG